MTLEHETTGERTPLLHPSRLSQLQHEQDDEAHSVISSTVTKEEQQLAGSTVGERLPYNDYTTIDWLHDLVIHTSSSCLNMQFGLRIDRYTG
jgi:chloride channel 3/4/5